MSSEQLKPGREGLLAFAEEMGGEIGSLITGFVHKVDEVLGTDWKELEDDDSETGAQLKDLTVDFMRAFMDLLGFDGTPYFIVGRPKIAFGLPRADNSSFLGPNCMLTADMFPDVKVDQVVVTGTVSFMMGGNGMVPQMRQDTPYLDGDDGNLYFDSNLFNDVMPGRRAALIVRGDQRGGRWLSVRALSASDHNVH